MGRHSTINKGRMWQRNRGGRQGRGGSETTWRENDGAMAATTATMMAAATVATMTATMATVLAAMAAAIAMAAATTAADAAMVMTK